MTKKISFNIKGMKCASCEVIIEREIRTLPGVRYTNVSHASGRMNIKLDDNARISQEDVNSLISKHGYSAEENQWNQNQQPKQEQTSKFNAKRLGGAVVLMLAAYIILKKLGLLSITPGTAEPTSLLAVLGIGLIASFSSCTAVVGGLIAAVSSSVAKNSSEQNSGRRILPHVLFNAGRLIGFAFFGAIIGWIGSSIQLSPTLNGIFVILIAVLMLGLGINLLDILPKGIASFRPPKWLAHKIHDLSESRSPFVPFVLGGTTFFLPCGFTQSMQLFALSLGNPFQSAVVMAVFALGTLPALFGIGAATSIAKGKTLKKIMRTAGAVVVVLGINNAFNGAALLGWSPTAIFAKTQDEQKTYQNAQNNEEQKISMNITEYGTYSPNVLTVVEGVPVEWTIYGPEFMGCANTLVLKAFGVSTYLKTGVNTVKFTPTKAGRFTFSCSMGMVRGTMIVLPKKS
ncbi:MAG: heavy metal transport/detoxification protein [uncultured bacterium]|nr:MAG: heavy metal transport/detoxification protein [uncultured bacterium]HBD05639.1 hypothetical protein [Candidatus Uhrbacteria bacterium]